MAYIGIVLTLLLTISTLSAQIKYAQTGYQFLSVNTDARAEAMGSAYTTVQGNSSSLFYNPAGIVQSDNMFDISLSRMQWIANITYNAMGFTFRPENGDYGVFGVSLMTVDYGDDIYGTMVWGNADGFIETGTINASSMALGIGYAKNLTDRFSVGGQVKFVTQHLGESVIPGEGLKKNLTNVYAFDFGTLYQTGFKSLVFGMTVRNFSQEIRYEQENFQLPLTFKMGLSMYVSDLYQILPDNQKVLVSFDAVHPRSFSEYINMGMEYSYEKLFTLRLGYSSSKNLYSMSYGFGVQAYGIQLDYAYVPFSSFDNVNRFTVRFSY